MPDAGLIVFPDEQPVTGAEPMSMFDPRTKRGDALARDGHGAPKGAHVTMLGVDVVDAKPDDVL
jgi:hypothetical protein